MTKFLIQFGLCVALSAGAQLPADDAVVTQPSLRRTAQLTALGYNPNNTSTDTSTPAGVGNSVAAAVSAWFINDGARQLQSYADYPSNQGGYVSVMDKRTGVLFNVWKLAQTANWVQTIDPKTGELIGHR